MNRHAARALAVFAGGLIACALNAADDDGLAIDVDGCALIENRLADTMVTVYDAAGTALRTAAGWRGRDSRYAVRAGAGQRVRIEALDQPRIDAGDFEVGPCPEALQGEVLAAVAHASDLHLRLYLGQSVDGAAVEEALLGAVRALAAAGLPLLQAELTFQYGTLLNDRGLNERAEAVFASALDLFRVVDDRRGEALSENMLGLIAWRDMRLDAAEAHFRRARELREALGDAGALARLSNNLGLLATDRGRREQAMAHFETALSHFQGEVNLRLAVDPDAASGLVARISGAADLRAALNVLNNLAHLHSLSGDVDLAERYWRSYLAFEAHLDDAVAVAQARHNLAGLLRRTGRLDEALLLQTEALRQFERAGAGRWQRAALRELGDLYYRIGDRQAAETHTRLALEVDSDDRRSAMQVAHQLGLMHLLAGRFDEARATLGEALTLAPQDSDLWDIWLVESDLARAELELGDAAGALARQQRAHQRLAEGGIERDAAIVLSRIAEIRIRQHAWRDAETLLLQALRVHRASGDVFAEFETLDRLSRVYRALDAARAFAIDGRLLELIDRLGETALPAVRRAELLARLREVFDRRIEALLARDRLAAAWQVAERSRLRGATRLRREQQRAGTQARRRQLLDRHAEVIEALHGEVLAREITPARRSVLARELDRIEVELAGLDRGAPRRAGPVGLSDVQRRLKPGELVLSYYAGAEQVWMWIIEPGRVAAAPAGDSAALNERIERLLATVRHPRNAPGGIRRLAAGLSGALLAPAAGALARAQRVLIQADGALHSLPFGMLPMPAGATDGNIAEPLAGGRAVGHLHSMLPGRGDDRNRAGDRLLVIADPGWQQGAAEQALYPSDSLLQRMLRDSALSRLPGTRREAEAILSLAGERFAVDARTGPGATRQFVVGGGLSGYRMLHIATHGLVDLDYPELSALMLVDGAGAGPAFLRPHDIARLDLNAELVVLSGCETGHGRTFAGSGAFSLARPFLIAGAERVLASLWKVDDHRTAEFMQAFYRGLLVDGEPPARALAQAQRSMRERAATAHPYYWAGFVLSSGRLGDGAGRAFADSNGGNATGAESKGAESKGAESKGAESNGAETTDGETTDGETIDAGSKGPDPGSPGSAR